MSYIIFTDSNTDIPYELAEQHDLHICYMPYTLNGEEKVSDLGRGSVIPDFYAAMRAGSTPTTSLLTPDRYIGYFEPHLKAGEDILFICFSSNLSGTYNCACVAQQELAEKYPDRRLVIVDSQNVSMGQAWLAMEAANLKKDGASMDEVAAWVETNKYRINYWFTVDDLVYLKRGGRISAATAAIGTMLSIKPMLTVTRDGRLISADKAKGRKKALRQLVDNCKNEIVDPENQVVTIMQADCENDAKTVAAMLEEAIPGVKTRTVLVGPTITAHAGPGTLALVYLGNERERM